MTRQKQFDVVIVGAGPAGLMAATWMAQTGIKTLIVEKEPCRTQSGRADGLESRTLEILDSFGIGERIWMESNRTMEVCLWSTGSKDGISRDSTSRNANPGLSRFQEATLGQGRIEEHLLEFIGRCPDVCIKWNTVPTSLTLHEELLDLNDDRPIEMQLKTHPGPDANNGEASSQGIESIQAKYLIGCDGARSWVRKQLGLNLEAKNANNGHWGVVDCVPTTDFPDLRKRCIIKSDAGNVMIIPREGSLVRFYIELSAADAARFKADWHPAILLTVLSNVLKPYYFVTSHVMWSTIYTVGQRLCKVFSVHDRVFLAGDAVHTHSPKAGQGMNVSMQDTYNLGWKLASVLKGAATPEILRTYQEERFPTAERLVQFDRRMCQNICSSFDGETADIKQPGELDDRFGQLQSVLEEENTTASGLSVTYMPGLLVTAGESSHSHSCHKRSVCSKPQLAKNIVLGRRLPDALVLCQSDSRPWYLQRRITSMGQWHLLVFGGDITDLMQMARVKRLAISLSHPNSVIGQRVLDGARDSVGSLAICLIHSAPRSKVQLMELPTIFRPYDEQIGYEYRRVFADNSGFQPGCGMAYKLYGIGAEGCIVLLRPDQHCAFIGALEDTDALESFFSRFTAVPN